MYIRVEAGESDFALGGDNASPGDFLERVIITVTNAAACEVILKDGSSDIAYTLFPNNPGSGVGLYPATLGMVSRKGQWKLTTSAGCTVIATGVFKG